MVTPSWSVRLSDLLKLLFIWPPGEESISYQLFCLILVREASVQGLCQSLEISEFLLLFRRCLSQREAAKVSLHGNFLGGNGCVNGRRSQSHAIRCTNMIDGCIYRLIHLQGLEGQAVAGELSLISGRAVIRP